MSRRRASRAVPAIVVALVLSACPSPSDPDPAPSARTADGPRITVAYPAEPPTLDPFAPAGRSAPTRDLVRFVMPSFFDAEGQPSLLDGPPTVSEGPPFEVEIRLRRDAVWSDGTPITADDVRATWRHARDNGLYGHVASVEVTGEHTARIRLSGRTTRWRELFSAGLGVLPAAHIGSLDRRWPVSGGPYEISRRRAGLDLRFDRNDAWWGSTPAIARIRVAYAPDPTGALELFERGRADVLGPYHAPGWQRRLEEAGASVARDIGGTTLRLIWARDRAPFRSRAVRDALPLTYDLFRILRGLVGQEGREVSHPAEDLQRARRLLRDAGWRGSPVRARNGRELDLTLAVPIGHDLASIVGRAVKFQAERAGIRFELVGLTPERFWGSWIDGRDMDAAMIIDRLPPPEIPGLDLYAVDVSLGARDGLTIRSHAGPEGPFAFVASWSGR